MRTKNLLLQAVLLAILSLLPIVSAQAEPFLFLTTPDQNGSPGTTVDFFGIIANGGAAPINVTEISASLFPGPDFGFQVITDVFFTNPGFGESDPGYITINPGEFTDVIPLFSVVIDRFAVQNFPFVGIAFVITEDGMFSNPEVFTITAVPEPTTMLLLGTGLAGVVGAARRRRRAAAGQETN